MVVVFGDKSYLDEPIIEIDDLNDYSLCIITWYFEGILPSS